MSNKRDFKKYVSAIGLAVCEDMMLNVYNVDGIDRSKVEKCVHDVLNAIEIARDNANVTFDKGVKAFADVKEYSREKAAFNKALFTKINRDFASSIDEALKEYNAAIPSAVRDANKAAVN